MKKPIWLMLAITTILFPVVLTILLWPSDRRPIVTTEKPKPKSILNLFIFGCEEPTCVGKAVVRRDDFAYEVSPPGVGVYRGKVIRWIQSGIVEMEEADDVLPRDR